MAKVINRQDARKAIESEGAYLHDNGSPISKFYLVWGAWAKWCTVRYETFYALKDELKLVSSRDGTGTNWKLPFDTLLLG